MKPVAVTLGVFAIAYLGMLLGRLPQLQLDRVGVALLGAIALVALGVLTIEDAAPGGRSALPTIALLFALMVLSAPFRPGVLRASDRIGDPHRSRTSEAALCGKIERMVYA